MSLKSQNDCLRRMIEELKGVGIPITGVYMPCDEYDGGLEIDDTYVLQIAPYHDPQFVLDVVESPGEVMVVFSKIGGCVQFFMGRGSLKKGKVCFFFLLTFLG